MVRIGYYACIISVIAIEETTDRTPSVFPHTEINSILRGKDKFVSILVCANSNQPLKANARSVLLAATGKVDIFHVDARGGEAELLAAYEVAFSRYRFSLILDSLDEASINSAVVHAIWRHTVPVYNGFYSFSSMFANGVAAWNEGNFSLSELLGRLSELNQHIKFMWSYQQILQEVIWYRYAHPLPIGDPYISTAIMAAHGKSLATIGVYSAKGNFANREAIRRTWGALLNSLGFEVVFFLSASDGDVDVVEEADVHGDIVHLPVKEGYRHNSRKGLLFLQWILKHRSNFKFLIKVDDDVYFRPRRLIEKLSSVRPVGYVWGFIDYISPVPKSGSSPFFNAPDVYPFATFPTYPRGVVRVVSMDIVEAISMEGHRKQLRMIYGDDPCFGVHLRQVAGSSVRSIVIDDFDSYSRFAMEPTCAKSWSSVTNDSWVVHHVTPTQISCLWNAERDGVFPACDCL
jgi:hypothetical protein